jgi:hypothetical protein
MISLLCAGRLSSSVVTVCVRLGTDLPSTLLLSSIIFYLKRSSFPPTILNVSMPRRKKTKEGTP